MNCQQAGCVKDAEVYVSNHSLGQVHALCREHAQWRMMEWQNAGYTAFWQTHIGDVEASAAKRTPTAMTQPDVTAETDGLQTMSIEEVMGGPEPEAAPEPVPIPEPEPEAEAATALHTDRERDEAIAFLFQQHKKTAAILLGMAERIEQQDVSGVTEFHRGPPVHPGAPETASEILHRQEPEVPVEELSGDVPLAEEQEPEELSEEERYDELSLEEALEEIPGEQDAWAAAGTVEVPAPEGSRVLVAEPELEGEAPQQFEELVLQFSPRHRYHKLVGSDLGNEPSTHTSGCGQESDAWEPKEAFAPGTHPCRKCWPKGE